jgi:hypothetical protein
MRRIQRKVALHICCWVRQGMSGTQTFEPSTRANLQSVVLCRKHL